VGTAHDKHVEIVRRGFEAFETMDMDAFVADWHAKLVWDVSGYDHWPGSKTSYTGPAEVLQEFGNFMGSVRALEVTDLEVTPLDEPNRVLATYHERRINEGEAEPVHLDIGIVYEIEDGVITRIEVYTGHERARKAAGLK
jgi:ketosteroid isomerase-like protein